MAKSRIVGNSRCYIYTRAELIDAGLVVNPRMWTDGTWHACGECGRETGHYAMSHPGQSDCYLVCGTCEQYSDRYPVREIEDRLKEKDDAK